MRVGARHIVGRHLDGLLDSRAARRGSGTRRRCRPAGFRRRAPAPRSVGRSPARPTAHAPAATASPSAGRARRRRLPACRSPDPSSAPHWPTRRSLISRRRAFSSASMASGDAWSGAACIACAALLGVVLRAIIFSACSRFRVRGGDDFRQAAQARAWRTPPCWQSRSALPVRSVTARSAGPATAMQVWPAGSP